MAEGRIQVGNTQEYLDTQKVTQSDGVIAQREVVTIGDPDTLNGLANVTNGALQVIPSSIESTVNTTTTPLSSGATFTGTFEQNHFPDVMTSLQTDNSGTLYYDFSVDGVNVNTFPVGGFKVSAGIHEFHTAVKGMRFFRARLVNDTGAQTYCRLSTYFGTYRASNTPLNQSIGLDNDGLSTRPTNFQDEVRIGRRTGVTGWNKFAYRTGLTAAGGEEEVWATAGNFTPMTTASTFTIAYTGGGGSNDGAGSTGATVIYFYYVDSDGLPAISIHVLGTDGSDVTSFSGLGINRAVVAATGTATFNNAVITITETTGGTTQAVIPATESTTQQAIFFTGSNHTAVAKYLRINLTTPNKTPVVLVKGYVFNRMVGTRYLIFREAIDAAVTLLHELEDPIGFNLNPTDVLYFVADSDSNSVDISIRFSLNEYQNS